MCFNLGLLQLVYRYICEALAIAEVMEFCCFCRGSPRSICISGAMGMDIVLKMFPNSTQRVRIPECEVQLAVSHEKDTMKI